MVRKSIWRQQNTRLTYGKFCSGRVDMLAAVLTISRLLEHFVSFFLATILGKQLLNCKGPMLRRNRSCR